MEKNKTAIYCKSLDEKSKKAVVLVAVETATRSSSSNLKMSTGGCCPAPPPAPLARSESACVPDPKGPKLKPYNFNLRYRPREKVT